MKIKHQESRFLAIVFATQLIAASAFSATTNWFQVIKDLQVGSPENVVQKTMGLYRQESWQTFTNAYSLFAHCLDEKKTAIWVVDVDPCLPRTIRTVDQFYIIAVFSEDKKLSDLLRFQLPIGFTPLVEGTYAKRLKSIEAGMNVDDIYRLLGVKSPLRYYRDESKRWKLEFSYSMSLSSTVEFQADAATGIITGKYITL